MVTDIISCIKVYQMGSFCRPDSSSVVSHEDDWRRIRVKSVFSPVIYFSDYYYNIYNQ